MVDESLLDRVKNAAPGFYTERDGGFWYIVTPDHADRIGEYFVSRDTARLFLLVAAGAEPMPDHWRVIDASRLSAMVEVGNSVIPTLWRRPLEQHFPTFAATIWHG
ncbi:hypothetical protein [Methylocystis hirsuta]|uniref:Uncharacterized protein n=1 Tax=Methylocystis hirsuta TaxID=369798 RepID=A0A3M9XM91_9HYPH|nr:hypothetical protein [Methylocystis hirsuta]RNJ49383.1 hypothetical protein D1O30_06985 [Methylocystis hirsuta]